MRSQAVEELEWRIQQLDELRRSDRRSAISRVTSIIGHLLGTPLNVIAGRAALIRAHAGDDTAISEDAARIERQVEQLATRIRAVMEFLSVPIPPVTPGKVGALFDDVAGLYEPLARARGLKLEIGEPTTAAAEREVDRSALFATLTSLVSLAVQEAVPHGTIELSALPAEASGGEATPAGFVRFRLWVPGMRTPKLLKLERMVTPESSDAAWLNRLQVLCICAATAERSGGCLEVGVASALGSELLLLWPCCA